MEGMAAGQGHLRVAFCIVFEAHRAGRRATAAVSGRRRVVGRAGQRVEHGWRHGDADVFEGQKALKGVKGVVEAKGWEAGGVVLGGLLGSVVVGGGLVLGLGFRA